MKKWRVEFDNDNGLWLYTSPTTRALHEAGYAPGAFVDDKTETITYTLHRRDNGRYPIIFETESLDQLNAYINLLLPPKDV